MTDTIFALATPPGRGGIAVVRVSGPLAAAAVEMITGRKTPPPRHAVLRNFTGSVSRETIDRGMVIFFAGPASYTGEDVAEFHLHGGIAVTDAMLDALAALPGLRMAEPGEFTRRAFENGKMDLTAAEAVADLIDAQTQAQRLQALDQMGGALAALYDGWRERLMRALAYLEADIDFPDEDLPQGVAEKIRPELEGLRAEIDVHLNDNRRGERLRDGIHVAVIGAPNAGKSSLVNALARREAAIVSPLPGTTRDVIEVHLDLGGYPVILSDTAGLRPERLNAQGHDAIEDEGIRRARQRAEQADIRLLLFDATREPDAQTMALLDRHAVAAFNKIDVTPAKSGVTMLGVSAKTGEGMTALTDAIVAEIKTLLGTRAAPAPTRQRHRAALEECAASLNRALAAPLPELAAEDARLAVRALGRLTGRVDVEDLLDVIFRDFCIGK